MVSRQHLLDRSMPTDGVFTTCTAMWKSGCRIVGTEITRAHLMTVQRGNLGAVIIAFCVVVRGSSDRGSWVRRIAAGSPPYSGTTISVFELPGLFSS